MSEKLQRFKEFNQRVRAAIEDIKHLDTSMYEQIKAMTAAEVDDFI